MRRSGVLGKSVLAQSGGAVTPASLKIDVTTVSLKLSPSAAEIYFDNAIMDSGTASILLTSSSTQIYAPVDANTSKVVFTPKLTAEVHTIFDNNTAIVKITPSIYETKKSGVVTGVIPPRNTIEFAAYLLTKLEREIERIKSNKRPTMPIYNKINFPQDVIWGQHVIATDGSLWIYLGNWNLIAGA